MIIANFCKGDTTKTLYGLWQWDYGQILRIQGLDLPTATEIHFSLRDKGGEAVTRIGTTKDGITDVTIPDSMLENNSSAADYMLFAFIYLTDETSGQTEYKICMQVKARPRPEAFDAPEDTELFREAIAAVNNSADRAEAAEKAAEGYANEANKDAEETAANRKEVERLVESVSGIEEDVKLVAEYKQAAQTAAQDADTSAKAAQTAQTAAETAKEAAETAQKAAETAAKEAAEDKTAVEQAKADVQTIQSQVAQDKASVEQTKTSFALTAQQAVADVNNAGQTQTDRVEDTGDAAVQDINTAKTQAVQAVNNAGATQVQTVEAEGDAQVSRVQAAAQEIVSDREQIQQNAQDIASIQQELVLKAPAIIRSVSGNPAIMQDSSEAPIQDLTMQGWTEQASTTGAQLLQSITEETKVINGITFEPISPTEIKIYGTAEQNADITGKYQDFKAGTYTLGVSEAVIGSRLRVCFTAKTGAPSFDIPNSGMSKTQELPEDISLAILIRVYAGTTINTTLKIMFNAGDAALPYEPYTGGQPSPNPDYPQEIVAAGDWDEENEKYEYEIKVTGKNILSIPDITPDTPERTIACSITGDITISAQEVPISISSNIWRIRVKYLDGTLLYFVDIDFLSLKSKTFYASEENPIIAITYKSTYITEGRYGDMQVEYGAEATAYEPYKSQDVTLTSDRPLTEWDRLEKRDGVWGWVYRTKKIILDKNNTWSLPSGKIEGYSSYRTIVDKNILFNDFICYSFKAYPLMNYMDENLQKPCITSYPQNSYQLIVTVPNELADSNLQTDLTAWNAWIEQKQIAIIYETAEETFTPLQDSEQAALNALHSNYPTTVISNEQDCDMSLTYIADTTNYINKTIQEAIQASIANNLLSANSTQALSAKMGAELNSRLEALEE